MNEFRLWINEKIIQRKREHADLLKVPETYAAMLRLNELQDQISDLQKVLKECMEFQRVTGSIDAKST